MFGRTKMSLRRPPLDGLLILFTFGAADQNPFSHDGTLQNVIDTESADASFNLIVQY